MAQIERIDQFQLGETSNAGFGEFSGMRYRGMTFKPSYPWLTALNFQLISTGSKGLKVFIENVNQSTHIPTGVLVGSFVIPNASLSTSLSAKYTLPTPIQLTPETIYAMYFAPWNTTTDLYDNDYRDLRWWNWSQPYLAGVPLYYNGGWGVSDSGNLDLYFRTYAKPDEDIGTIEVLRPNGVGTISNMDSVSGAPTKWEAVDEATADGAYIYEPRNSYAESFALPDSAIAGGSTINRVRVWCRWRGVDQGADGRTDGGLYIGGTEYYHSKQWRTNGQNTFREDFVEWTLNPATGSAFTVSDINAMQPIIRHIGTVGSQYDQVWVEVDYSAGGGVTPVNKDDFFNLF